MYQVFTILDARHIDSAQVYRNEAEVGAAVAESGLKREEVFISEYTRSYICSCGLPLDIFQRRKSSAATTAIRRR